MRGLFTIFHDEKYGICFDQVRKSKFLILYTVLGRLDINVFEKMRVTTGIYSFQIKKHLWRKLD